MRLRSSSDGRAHEFVLLLDRLHAVVAGLGDHAGNLAGARRRRIEQFVEQAGEALQPLREIVGAGVERRDQRFDVCVLGRDQLFGAAIALFQKLDRFGERAAVRAELRGEFAEFAQRLGGDGVERADMLLHHGGAGVALEP